MPAGQDGFKLSPNCQPKSDVSIRKGSGMVSSVPAYPCGCAQKTLSAGCGLVIVPSEVPMATTAQKTRALVAQGKLSEFSQYREGAV